MHYEHRTSGFMKNAIKVYFNFKTVIFIYIVYLNLIFIDIKILC